MAAQAPPSAHQIAEAVLLDEKRRNKLFAYACARFGINDHDAEDLLQETALELLHYRGYVRKPDGFVFAVFRTRCSRFIAMSKKRRDVFVDTPSEELTSASAPPLGLDRSVALREALGGISSACKRLLAAYYVEGRSLREAAEAVALRYSSVAKTLGRCLRKLRRCLA